MDKEEKSLSNDAAGIGTSQPQLVTQLKSAQEEQKADKVSRTLQVEIQCQGLSPIPTCIVDMT